MSAKAYNHDTTKGLVNKLFFLWLLLLPFSRLTATFTGVIAIDKALAPVLLVLGLWRQRRITERRMRGILLYALLAGLFMLATNMSLLMSRSELFWSQIGATAVNMGYFMLPVLYIRDIQYFRKVSGLIIIVTLFGSLSVFLVSAGLLTLPYERFEASRLGLEYLPKSIGVIGTYGDMAQLCAYTILLTLIVPKQNYFFGFGARPIKATILLVLLLGIIGSQSRNIVVSIFVSMLFARALLFAGQRADGKHVARIMALFAVSLLGATLLATYAANLYDAISGLGGTGAQRTAEGRLGQYQLAWKLFVESPFFGVDGGTYARMSGPIDYVHSLWLGVAVRGGIVGLLILLFWLFWSFRGAFRAMANRENFRDAVVVAAYFAAVVTSVSFYPAHRVILFWTLLGVMSSLSYIEVPRRKGSSLPEPVGSIDFRLSKCR